MKRIKGICIVACFTCLVSLGLVLAGCGSNKTSANGSQSKGPIVIGAAMAFTGYAATWDAPVYAAAELAVADINAKGGVLGRQLKLVKADMKSDPAQGPLAASQVLDAGAQAVIVTTDFDAGSPAALVAQSRGVISFSGAISPKFGPLGVGDLAYSFSDASMTEGAVGAEFAISKGWKTVWVLTDQTSNADTDYSKYFIEAYTKLGGKVLGHDVFKNDDASIAAQIAHVQSLSPQPDCIQVSSYSPGGPAALRQIRAAGVNLPMIGCEDWDGTYWMAAIPGVKDVYGTVPRSEFGDDPDQKVNEFFARLEKSMNKKILDSSLSIGGYSIIQVYAKAVEMAGSTDPKAVSQALNTLTDFPALSGPYTYTATQHIPIGRPMTMISFFNGTGHFAARITPTYTPTYTP
jgi:branched-chain amino acid transport system substrate-binding protein